MPTIEILSLGCETVPDLPTFSSFTFIAESDLQSHRALFQPVFDTVSGVIVHLGNKELEKDLKAGKVGFWFCGDLIDWSEEGIKLPIIDPALGEEQWWGEDQDYAFRFLRDVVPEMRELFSTLLQQSPVGQIFFSTDYQFGPAKAMQRSNYTISQLFEEHERWGLRWNCLYQIMDEGRGGV